MYQLPLSTTEAQGQVGALKESLRSFTTDLNSLYGGLDKPLKLLSESADKISQSLQGISTGEIGAIQSVEKVANALKNSMVTIEKHATALVKSQQTVAAGIDNEIKLLDRLVAKRKEASQATVSFSKAEAAAITEQMKATASLLNQAEKAVGARVASARASEAAEISKRTKDVESAYRVRDTLEATRAKQIEASFREMDGLAKVRAAQKQAEEDRAWKAQEAAAERERGLIASRTRDEIAGWEQRLKDEAALVKQLEAARQQRLTNTAAHFRSSAEIIRRAHADEIAEERSFQDSILQLQNSYRSGLAAAAGHFSRPLSNQFTPAGTSQAQGIAGVVAASSPAGAVSQAANSQASLFGQTAAQGSRLNAVLQSMAAHLVGTNQQFNIGSQATAGFRAMLAATGAQFGMFASSTIAVATAVYALSAAITETVALGAQFEDTMNRALVIMEADTVAEIMELTEAVRQVGATTRFTATEAAEGLTYLGMAGLSSQEAMQALSPALNLATLGMTDMAFAADLVTNVMNEFGKTAADIEEISDILAKASLESNASIQEIGQSLSYVGPIANETGNSLKDTVALIELMANNSIKASRAGTALRRAMSNLSDPSKEALDTMRTLGVTARTLDGAMLPLVDVMYQLARAGAETQDVVSIFGVYAAPAVISVLKTMKEGFDSTGNEIVGFTDKFEILRGGLEEVAGTANRMRQELDQVVTGDLQMLTSSLSEVALTAFYEVSSDIRLVLKDLTQDIRNLSERDIKAFARGLYSVGEALATVATYVPTMAALYVSLRLGAPLVAAASAAFNLFQHSLAGTSVQLSASGAAMAANNAGMLRLTGSLFMGSTAARALGASLMFVSQVAVPLMIIGAIGTAVYQFSTASEEASTSTAKLRIQMAYEAEQAKNLADRLKEANTQERERIALQAAAKVTDTIQENWQELDSLVDQRKGIDKRIAILKEQIASPVQILPDGMSVVFDVQAAAKEITDLEAKKVELGDRYQAGLRATVALNQQLRESQEAVSVAQLGSAAAAKATSEKYLEAVRAANAIANLPYPGMNSKFAEGVSGSAAEALISQEKRDSDARMKFFKEEADHTYALRETAIQAELEQRVRGIQHISVAVKEQELKAAVERRAALEDSFDYMLKAMDAEIKQAESNMEAARANLDVLDDTHGGQGSDPAMFNAANEVYQETAKNLADLKESRMAMVRSFTETSFEMAESIKAGEASVPKQLSEVRASLDTVYAAEVRYTEAKEVLAYVSERLNLSDSTRTRILGELERSYRDVAEPAEVFVEKARESLRLSIAQEAATKSGNFQEVARLTFMREHWELNQSLIDQYAQILAKEYAMQQASQAMEKAAKAVDTAWGQALDRIDQAFEDVWAGAFDSFTDFREKLQQGFQQLLAFLAHQAITKPILLRLQLANGGSAAQGAASGTVASGVAQGLFGSAASSVLGAAGSLGSFLSSGYDGLGRILNPTGWGLSNSTYLSGSYVPTGMEALKTGLYGVAGGYAGTALGESLFNKQAESSIGASLGGLVGSIWGPLGAAIGAALGGAVDAATGGDGKKRVSAGFSVGPAAVKSQYEYGTTTFDSGLVVTNVARRVDQGESDKITEYFQKLDSTVSAVTRAAGINLDLRNFSPVGMTADEGIGGTGSFFGLKGYNNLSPEQAKEALAGQGLSYVQQIIAEVTKGMSEEVIAAVTSATGTAEEVIENYAAVLSLDGVFKRGGKVFSDVGNFADTLRILTEEFRVNDEALQDTAARVIAANEAITSLGIGDGTVGSAKMAVGLYEAAGGFDAFMEVTSAFTSTVVGQETVLRAAADRLRSEVAADLSRVGLAIEGMDLAKFAQNFDQVKNSLDATSLIDMMRVGNQLAELISLEKQLSDTRKESLSEYIDSVEASGSRFSEVASLISSIAGDMADIRGVNSPIPAITGDLDQQLEAISAARDAYMNNYKLQLNLEKEAHEEKVRNYKEQLKLSKSLTDTITDLSLSENSALTSKQKRDALLADFTSLYQKGMGGDVESAEKAQSVAKAFIEIERQRETINDTFQASYRMVIDNLTALKDKFGGAVDPGQFSESGSAASAEALRNLTALQARLLPLQTEAAGSAVGELKGISALLKDLPADIAKQFRSALGPELLQLLQMGVNFGLLNTGIKEVATGIGILPKVPDLSSDGVANSLNNLTKLAEFPFLLGKSFSDTVGSVLVAMANSKAVPVADLATAVANNPQLTNAWNQYAGANNLGTVESYLPAASQPSVADQVRNSLAASGGSLSSDPDTRLEQARALVEIAQRNNMSAEQAAALWNANFGGQGQVSAANLNTIASMYNLPMFGTGAYVSGATAAIIGEAGDEYVAPVETYAVVEREKMVERIVGAVSRVVSTTQGQSVSVSGDDRPIIIQLTVVTEDGKELVNRTIDNIKARSSNGEYVVNAKGVRD